MSTGILAATGRAVERKAWPSGWNIGLILVCVGILAYGVLRQLRVPGWPFTVSDYVTYYNAALAIRHGADPFLSVVKWTHSYQPGTELFAEWYVYTPAFAVLLIPFTFLPFPIAFLAWEACNLFFLVGAVYCCLRLASIRPSLTHLLALSAAASLLIMVRLEFNWGQADLFILFFIAAAFWARQARGPIPAGILLAIACITKPPVLALVAFLLWKREFKFALTTVVAFVAMMAAPFLWVDPRTWRDQLAVWQFWSTQYVPFLDNESPKGVLARLFMINPAAHPLVVAPALITPLWLVVVAIVALLAAAVVRPQPLGRDIWSLQEIGIAISAMLLISPLTEYIYTTLLIVPMLGLYALVRRQHWLAAPYRRIALCLAGIWLVLCLPIQHIEFYFGNLMGRPTLLSVVYQLLAPVFLYVLIAFLAVQLFAIRLLAGRSTGQALRQFFREAPAAGRQWLRDVGTALTATRTEGALAYLLPVGALLALAAVVAISGRLPDPTNPRYVLWDHYKYIIIAQHPFSTDPAVHAPPFSWRLATPLLVHILPVPTLQGFWLVTIASLIVASLAVGWFLRALGVPSGAALAGSLAFAVLGPATGFPLWDYMLADPLSFVWLGVALVFAVRRRGLALVIALALFAVTKEMAIFAALFALAWALEQRDWRMVRWASAGVLLCLGINTALHAAIPPWFVYNPLGGAKWTLVQMAHAPTIALQRAVAMTVGTWNILLPVAALQLLHPPKIWRSKALGLLVLLAAAQVVISASDVERIVVYGYPAVLAACCFEVEYLAQRFRTSRWFLWIPILAVELLWWYPFTQDRITKPLYVYQLNPAYQVMAACFGAVTLVIVWLAVRRSRWVQVLTRRGGTRREVPSADAAGTATGGYALSARQGRAPADAKHAADAAGEAVPFLSVTVLNYNYAHYLKQCLDSILGQTWRDFEVLVINDCSTDNSLEVIEPYLADPRVRLINHTVNRGYVASLIEGCERSRGEYISVISADDYALEPTAFETAHQVLEANQGVALFFSAWHEVDDDGQIRYTRRAADDDYVVDGTTEIRRLLLSSPILHSGTIIRRDAYFAVGGYDARFRFAVDNNMWLALCAAGKVAYVNTPLYVYRAHGTNMSNTDVALDQTTEEMLLGVDYALSLFPDEALPDKAALRRRARQRALVAVPTHDIFAGRYQRGWAGYWRAFRKHPLLTIGQPRTVTLLLRTALGSRVYGRVRPTRSVYGSGSTAPQPIPGQAAPQDAERSAELATAGKR